MPDPADNIGQAILDQAVAVGTATWNAIQKSAPIFVRGYAQALVDIASGLANGSFSKKEAGMLARNARFLLDLGIANTSQITLAGVQNFLNGVIKLVKGRINGLLPVPVL